MKFATQISPLPKLKLFLFDESLSRSLLTMYSESKLKKLQTFALHLSWWPNVAGRIKALLLRQHSDWFGDIFGELRLPHCGSPNKTRRNRLIHIWICLLWRVLLRHVAIDESRWISLLQRVLLRLLLRLRKLRRRSKFYYTLRVKNTPQ